MTVVRADPRRLWTIYCEGFHDRDFLAGVLEDALGFATRRGEPGVPRGVFAFRWSDSEVRIQPCESKSKVVPVFDAALREANARRPAGLVMCLDERDDDVAPTASESLGSARDRLHAMVANAIAAEPTLAGSMFDRTTGGLRLKDGSEVRLATITVVLRRPHERSPAGPAEPRTPDHGRVLRGLSRTRRGSPRMARCALGTADRCVVPRQGVLLVPHGRLVPEPWRK